MGNGTECDTNDPAVAGLSVEPMSGSLKVWGERDVLNATVSFQVSQLTCVEADDIIDDNSAFMTTAETRRRSRRLLDTSCFNNIAAYGNLVITKATSLEQPDCYDGRIYPM